MGIVAVWLAWLLNKWVTLAGISEIIKCAVRWKERYSDGLQLPYGRGCCTSSEHITCIETCALPVQNCNTF
jgi:hypothetical protein